MISVQSVLAADPPPPPPPFEIIKSEFGLFDNSKSGDMAFEPGNKVPAQLGQVYGWVITLTARKPKLVVYEQYVLPGKKADSPQSMEQEALNPGAERKARVSQRLLAPLDGRIYAQWSVGAREPKGHRTLEVWIENQLAATFEFDVE